MLAARRGGALTLVVMLRPMLPSTGALPQGPGWVAEPKMDGWRAVVEVSGYGKVTVCSRHGTNLTDRFPELAVLSAYGPVVLDGELVVCGHDGRPDFYALGRQAGERRKAELAVFDVLALGDKSLVGRPYHLRREILEGLDLPGCASPVPVDDVAAMWDAAGQAGLEGVVAKRVDATYRPGVRSRVWVKAKHWQLNTLVVCGYVAAPAGITCAAGVYRGGPGHRPRRAGDPGAAAPRPQRHAAPSADGPLRRRAPRRAVHQGGGPSPRRAWPSPRRGPVLPRLTGKQSPGAGVKRRAR